MKTIIALLLSCVSAISASVNITNETKATSVSTNDYVLGLTNTSISLANGKTRLLKVGDLLSLVPPSGGGQQPWTNDGTYFFPSRVNTFDKSTFLIDYFGEHLFGSNVLNDFTFSATDLAPLWAVSMTDSNEPSTIKVGMLVLNNEDDFDNFSQLNLTSTTAGTVPNVTIDLQTASTSADAIGLTLQSGAGSTFINAATNSKSVFSLDTNGVVLANGFSCPTNQNAIPPVLALGEFRLWPSNGLALWYLWNTNGTTVGHPLP